MTDFKDRWTTHWVLLGLQGDAHCRARLLASDGEAGRHYHTAQHLAECLDLFDAMAGLAAAPHDGDSSLVVDIDLAILGAAPARYLEYTRQVRAEYAAVPAAVYRVKRRAVLARFLARPAIYTTPALRARLEAQARRNLQECA